MTSLDEHFFVEGEIAVRRIIAVTIQTPDGTEGILSKPQFRIADVNGIRALMLSDYAKLAMITTRPRNYWNTSLLIASLLYTE